MVERLVPPRAPRHRRPADQAQSQGRHGRGEDRRRRPDRRLCGDHHRKRRHQIDHDAARGDHRRRDRDRQSLPPNAIDQGTGRGLSQYRSDLRRRQRDPDSARVPVMVLPQERAQEWPHPIPHVREEHVQAVERAEAHLRRV